MGKFVLLLVCCVVSALSAGEIVVADQGKSAFQIVLPDPGKDKTLDKYIELSGRMIQHTVRNASGVEIPLVRESAATPGKPGIYVGATRKLAAAGFSSGQFGDWEYAVQTKNGDIFVYGRDAGNPVRGVEYPAWFVHYMLGTLKGAIVFAETFANTRVVHGKFNSYGLHEGVKTLRQERIAVPENFSLRRKPRFLIRTSGDGLVADVANNILRQNRAWFTHAHTHEVAVPQKKYFKSHPEYFALVKGKRYWHPERSQYCISNPEFQKILYDYMVGAGRSGAGIIALGHSDGTIPCECEPCKKLYGVTDWGEKLWILHRDIAAKLEKDCPGVQVVIYNYGITIHPPETFRKFPDNVIVMMAPATLPLIEKWKNYSVKHFWSYCYFWGNYLGSGYSPARSLEFLKEQADLFRSPAYAKVVDFYFDGGAPQNGLGGVFRYVFFRMLEDPGADPKTLLKEYCKYGYGEKGEAAMEKFFLALNERLHKGALPKNEDWNDFSQLLKGSAVKVWSVRYPPEEVAKLDALFREAEKLCDSQSYLFRAAKWEFGYLKVTAAAVNALNCFNADSSEASLQKLVAAIEARNAFIASIPRSKLVKAERAEANLFSFAPIARIHAGGVMQGAFGDPICMDLSTLSFERKTVSVPPVSGFGDWKNVSWQPLPAPGGKTARFPAKFRIGRTADALLIDFEAKVDPNRKFAPVGRDGAAWKDDCMEFFIIPPGSKKCFQLIVNPVENSTFDMVRDVESGKGDGSWNGIWSYRPTLKGEFWRGELTIPFKTLETSGPEKEELWRLQSGRSAFPAAGERELLIWNTPLNGKLPDPRYFGEMQLLGK